MIDDEKLNRLYNGVLEGVELTTKTLSEYGFTSKELTELVKNGTLERIQRGVYTLKSVDGLCYYGKGLIAAKNFKKATLCFEKCIQIDPNHKGASFQLFMHSIENKDYERAFALCEVLEQSDNKYYKNDLHYFLYLLSIITELPEKYRDYVRYFQLDDIKVFADDKRYEDINYQNKIRSTVLNRRFSYAIIQLKKLIDQHQKRTVQDRLSMELLNQVKEAEAKSRTELNQLIISKKYQEAKDHLLAKQERHNLGTSESLIVQLLDLVMKINATGYIPPKSTIKANNLFDAIEANDYQLALQMSKNYNKKYNIAVEDSGVYLLLNDICILINSFTKEEKVETKKLAEEKPIEQPVTPAVQSEPAKDTEDETTIFLAIVSALMNGDFNLAYGKLKDYLALINKSDYEILMVNLIKLSLLHQDLAFVTPMATLSLISQDNYEFDVKNYIQDFYVSLSQNKLDEAKIYLDIISQAGKFGQAFAKIDVLQQVLNLSEKAPSPSLDKKVVEPTKKEERKNTPLPVTAQPKIVTTPDKTKTKKVCQGAASNLIANKYDRIVRHGLFLTKPLAPEAADNLIKALEEYPDIQAFPIETEDGLQMVLKYHPLKNEFVDVKGLFATGNNAFKNGNYAECIRSYLKLLTTFNRPKAGIYSELGLAYMKCGNIALAIDYLTVANVLAKEENLGRDYTDLILRLKGYISEFDVKPSFKMREEEFDYDDVSDFYGIDNFAEINEFITNSGLDVESACQILLLPTEKVELIKLIYAREFYFIGDFEKGDAFVNSVEKSKNKTQRIIELMNEIRKSKMFYKNRQREIEIPIVRSLIPNKKNS